VSAADISTVAPPGAHSGADERTFSPRTVLLLVLVGVFSFVALMVFGAYAPDSQGKDDGGAHGLSRSAVGYAGLVTLLHELGRPAVVARGPVDMRTPSIMVLTIDEGNPKTPLLALPTTRGYPWPVLAILPKWQVFPTVLPPVHVRKGELRKVDADTWIGHGDKSIVLGHTPGVASHRLIWVGSGAELRTGQIDQLQVFTAMPGWQPLIIDEKGGIVLARAKEQNFYALSEPDLLNTQGLAQIANAETGLAVLETVPGGHSAPVFFDVTLNGFGRSRSLIKLAVEPPFLAATLSALAAAVLAGWAAFNRFGAARRQGRAFALGKRALADNQAALIRMARREHRLGGRYAQAIRDLVARAVGAPRDLEGPALDAFLDRLSANRGVKETLADLSRDAAAAKTAHDITAVAQRLYRWRLATTGEHTP
jgi:hypothetical protein